jgi:hypothetical protein
MEIFIKLRRIKNRIISHFKLPLNPPETSGQALKGTFGSTEQLISFAAVAPFRGLGVRRYELKTCFYLINLLIAFSLLIPSPTLASSKKKSKIQYEETIYENKPHFIIKTKSITWYFDKEGGGFSRMIDKERNDWISFKREPWNEYPASAASAFRGIPNLVFKSDDGGAGHPGHEKCNSAIEGNKIITKSKSGNWKWSWEFFDDYARLEILKTDPNQPYWFLYEGTPGGKYTPADYYFGTSKTPTTTELPDFYKGTNIFGNFQWIYCGSQKLENTFYMVHLQSDEETDMAGFLGNTTEGLNSPDGMTVFGFGRDEKGNPLLTGNQKFVVGFYPQKVSENDDLQKLTKYIQRFF